MVPDIISKYHNKKKRATPKIKYAIKINSGEYHCFGYEEITLTVPKKSVLKKAESIWNGIALTVDIISVLAGGDTFLPPSLSENETCNISVIRLTDNKNNKVLDIISKTDKEIIEYAAKKNKIEYDVDSIAYVDDLQIVVDQFAKQCELYKKNIAEEKARQKQLKEEAAAQKKAEEEAFISALKTQKISYYSKITTAFYEKNLLTSHSLSNSEKLKEYSIVRDFCIEYMPELNQRDFNIDSILPNYTEFVSESACLAFKENWIRLSRSYNVLKRGDEGEKKVYEVLRLFDDRIRILRDYVWGHEHDFIVITPYGISTIEVKNLRGDYVLTETGILKCVSSDKVKPKDVALQSKKHLETLRRNLNGCSAFSSNVPLQEIICSAESNFTIRDEYHYIPVCYYNTVDKALFPENTKPVLTEKAMDAIEKYLLENRREAFKFDVFLPRGEIDSRDDFIKCFADVASGYIVAQNKVV